MKIKNIKKIKPLFNRIITTAEVYTEDEMSGEIIVANKVHTVKEYQKVLSVGPMVKGIKEGDIVMINSSRYQVRKFKEDSLKADMDDTYNQVVRCIYNTVELDGEQCLLLYDADIEYIIEDYEEDTPSKIIKINTPKIVS